MSHMVVAFVVVYAVRFRNTEWVNKTIAVNCIELRFVTCMSPPLVAGYWSHSGGRIARVRFLSTGRL